MSKTNKSKGALNAQYNYIINAGSGRLQNLLTLESALYYGARAEGWAFDIYDIDGVAICDGYAPFGNIKPACYTIERYDRRAKEIINEYKTSDYEVYGYQMHQLCKCFVRDCIEEYKTAKELTKHQREVIADNIKAYRANFNFIAIRKDDYNNGFYVFASEDALQSGAYCQYCYNIDYLNGWLYGAVQANVKMLSARNELLV